jgi:glycosyltransferase involved in cell wall biosynthesis
MKIGYEAKRIFHNTTGLGNYSRDLIRIMETYFPDNQYVLYNPKQGKVARLKIDNKTIFEKRPQSFLTQKLSSFWRRKWMTKDVVADKVEIFHGLSGELPLGLAKTNLKTVVTIHDLIFMRFPDLYSSFDRKIHYKKFKQAAEDATVVVAISEQTKHDIITFLKIDAHKVKVLYQGCAPAFKENYTTAYKAAVLKKYKLPQKFILNVGTIEPRKNALNIVKAIKELDYNLVLVGGGGKYKEKVKAFVATNNMEHRVFFLEGLQLKELASLYQSAFLFVYPSVFEGFGIPIIEALYSKTPVITSTGSCFAEAGGTASIYVKPNDIMALKEAIIAVQENEQLSVDMIEKGFKFVQQFNDKQIAKNWNKLYTTL